MVPDVPRLDLCRGEVFLLFPPACWIHVGIWTAEAEICHETCSLYYNNCGFRCIFILFRIIKELCTRSGLSYTAANRRLLLDKRQHARGCRSALGLAVGALDIRHFEEEEFCLRLRRVSAQCRQATSQIDQG